VSETVSLEELNDEKYARVLCYPRYNSLEAAKRIRELKQLGVKTIEFSGEKQAFNIPILGKGCVGLVVVARTKTGRAALKIRRLDADRKGMEHEAEMLKKANSIGIGPRFIGFDEDFLLMEFVEGMLLPKWVENLKGRGAKKKIRLVLRDILGQCWKLDKAGLDHGELSRAPKHVIIDADDKARIVDFETASLKRRTSNVTSICQYLFLGSQTAKVIRRKLQGIESDTLITVLRAYKLNSTRGNFLRILQVCGSTQ